MGSEDDAAGLASPMVHVQAGVVFREAGVPGVAENALDEVQVADEAAGRKEADLHRLAGNEAGHLRANQRPDEQGDETFRRLRLRGREGKAARKSTRLN